MKSMKKIVAVVFVAALITAGLIFILKSRNRSVETVNKTANGIALQGYDAVAYFNESKATEGKPEFSHEWNGAKWLFANPANRDAFKKEPEKYAPQYGGYCSWAVSRGYTANADPRAWKIVDGKLFLNYNKDVQKRWEEDIPGNINSANQNWITFQTKKPEHKGN